MSFCIVYIFFLSFGTCSFKDVFILLFIHGVFWSQTVTKSLSSWGNATSKTYSINMRHFWQHKGSMVAFLLRTNDSADRQYLCTNPRRFKPDLVGVFLHRIMSLETRILSKTLHCTVRKQLQILSKVYTGGSTILCHIPQEKVLDGHS